MRYPFLRSLARDSSQSEMLPPLSSSSQVAAALPTGQLPAFVSEPEPNHAPQLERHASAHPALP